MSMTYSKTNWANGIAPAINSTNLGNIETFNTAVAAAAGSGTRSALGTLDADLLGATAANKFWYSSGSAGGSDGNGGQPPAPRPANSPSGGADTQGQYSQVNVSGSTASLYPAGTSSKSGRWAYMWVAYNTAAGTIVNVLAGEDAGTTVQTTAAAANTYRGFAWRVS